MLSIIDKWGKKRKAIRFKCSFCLKEVVHRIWKNRLNKFCSQDCASAYKSRKVSRQVECLMCNKTITRPISRVRIINFCNRECKELFQSAELHPNWKDGRGSYRERCIRKFGFICNKKQECPLKNISLPEFGFEVDHIDSNRNNNKIENLQVLCLLCHREKSLVKWKNKKMG